MPDMDGVTLLSEIRKVYAEMPVFLLTAHGALCTAIEAIRNGANDYILKPVNPVDLLHRIEAVMQKVGKQKRRQEIELRLDCLIQELQRIDAPQQKSANASHLVEGSAHENQKFLERGNLRIYLANRKAFLEGNELDLPPSAFDYLVCLARRAPQPVSYEDLTLEVQGYRLGRNEARQIARWQIYQLRQAIESDADQPQYVLNQRGFGYRLANLG
jgi:DNA-binding response OmpR family regulator